MIERNRAKSSTVGSLSQPRLIEEAHARDFSTFSEHCAVIGKNGHAPNEPGHPGDVSSQRADDNVGDIAMDRERRQLSDDPAFISSRAALESAAMDVFPEMFDEGAR